jgi:hypothetical protein
MVDSYSNTGLRSHFSLTHGKLSFHDTMLHKSGQASLAGHEDGIKVCASCFFLQCFLNVALKGAVQCLPHSKLYLEEKIFLCSKNSTAYYILYTPLKMKEYMSGIKIPKMTYIKLCRI